ncbi:5-(carboxyamino)imidazole ribonucleotide synthase [Fimbriimonas ginsengisoli]|uniref:N5-carboxyaminoimidazole ribonucleotide synthase n=1 Tax=Fimbriimonas ginsengisoli Gsoil 348 TaxID=661478 RepID=A0A068NQ75_FIMGI|nr:5-(carboxyamino)imidazole ribonucleotide synthase [Fimbriimonas ginsengisoli]AIE85713.1 phosphoribosylaminoimidazole carboxylase, ATPase subunit [Fimbriimonas ginsengisoli Gsoil 348]
MTFDLGFLGGGQLARMSIQAAQRMGFKCLSLDPGADTPASQIAESVQGSLSDPSKIAEILNRCERVTLENEFIPAAAIREAVQLSGRNEEVVIPGIDTLATIQDKLLQRQALIAAGVASPRAVPMDDGGKKAIAEIGFPMVLKARFGGYDGKGTRYAKTPEELEQHRPLWEGGGWLAEEFVPFRRELAVMVAVDSRVQVALHTVETIQTNHVCDFTFPSHFGEYGQADGTETAVAAIRAVGGYGLFGVELFETADGRLLVNEIAPRPHNTGHYTLDWGEQSQFDYHVRLVAGLPIEEGPAGNSVYMANLLGQPSAGDYRRGVQAALERYPGARVHWYGKTESKPGRKMGHINLVARPGESNLDRLREIRRAFYEAWTL